MLRTGRPRAAYRRDMVERAGVGAAAAPRFAAFLLLALRQRRGASAGVLRLRRGCGRGRGGDRGAAAGRRGSRRAGRGRGHRRPRGRRFDVEAQRPAADSEADDARRVVEHVELPDPARFGAVEIGEVVGPLPATEKSLRFDTATAGTLPCSVRGTCVPNATARKGDGFSVRFSACSARFSQPSGVIFKPGVPDSM